MQKVFFSDTAIHWKIWGTGEGMTETDLFLIQTELDACHFKIGSGGDRSAVVQEKKVFQAIGD